MFKKFNYLYVGTIVWALLMIIFFIAKASKTSIIGNSFQDTLVFDGISYAISYGLKPSIDFYATMIVPFYVRYFASIIANGAFAENIELWIYSVILSIVFFALLYKKVKPLTLMIIISVTILFMMIRVNFINTSSLSTTLYLFSHAGSYNRFLDLLIMGVIFSAIPSLDSKTVKYTRILFYAIVFLLCIYTKISTLPIILLLVTTIVLASKNYNILDLFAIYILTLLSIIVIWYFTGIGKEYFEFLSYLGEFKSLRIQEEIVHGRSKQIFYDNLNVISIIFLSIATYNYYFRDKFYLSNMQKDVLNNKEKYLKISSEFYILIIVLISIISITMFTLTNYGDMGFFPLVALFYVASKTLAIHHVALPGNAKRYFIILFVLFFSLYGFKLIKAVTHRAYYIYSSNFIPLSQALDILNKNKFMHHQNVVYGKYLVDQAIVNELLGEDRLFDTLIPRANLMDNKNYITSFCLLKDMNYKLDILNITKDKSIYLLDFPAYYFAMLRNSRVPKHTYPFLLYNHEIGKEFHPKAEDLFRDVDIVIMTQVSLNKNNKMYLNELYDNYIIVNYNLIYQNKYYKIFEKKKTIMKSTSRGLND